ncbi:MAG: helix-turn-helix transcriptional regulator [Firmicutes bacterium]|nr:helix-turn-helix transcriptional regulator [Bacillota bacterium]
MICAYDEKYLDDAMRNLGEAADFALNDLGIEPEDFIKVFVGSGIADQFGKGVPKYVSGMSGIELVMEMAGKTGMFMEAPETEDYYDYTPEYWCGWIIAYYQWVTGKSFREIFNHVTLDEILCMYGTFHEASEEKFVDALNRRLASSDSPANLQKIRKEAGYSQKELSEKSGVSLRMIQQYEQGAKDINKASVLNLAALAKVLGCRIEDMIES